MNKVYTICEMTIILENNNNKNVMTRYRRKECLLARLQLKGLLSVKEYSMTSIAKRDDICGNKITRALQLLVKANIIQHENFNQHIS